MKATPDSPRVRLNSVFLAVSFCQPFIITRHSSWLSKIFNFVENSCNDHCNTGVPFGQHNCSYKELCVASSVFRRHVFVVTLRDRWQRCAVTAFNRGRALLKAVIGLRWLSIAGVRRKLNRNETRKSVHWQRDISTYSCDFSCVRKIAQSDYQHRHSCLSVRPHGTFRLLTGLFS